MNRLRALISGGWRDSLLRNSMHLMLSTVLTGGLGFVFWTVAARRYDAAEVGLAASAVAVATALSLVIHLGPAAMMIERLPRYEGTEGWGARVWTATLGTSVASAALAAVFLLLFGHTAAMGELSSSPTSAVLVVLGCAAWSGSNVLAYTFVAARRADQTALNQTFISVLKLLLMGLFMLSVFGLRGQDALISAWSLSAVAGTLLALLWQFDRAGLPLGPPRLVRPSRQAWRNATGHHLTSAGGVLTPYLLPPLVAVLLSPADNAYFYLTWMLGSLFFMVSPSISASLFAEGVHNPQELPSAVRRTAKLTALLLTGPVLVTVLGGKLLLGIFGADYADNGYLLLILLVVSTVPDAVTNVAVGLFRATGELWRSTVLNIGMSVLTLAGAAVLAPAYGITGAGLAWLIAQTLGALWVLPRLVRMYRAPEQVLPHLVEPVEAAPSTLPE